MINLLICITIILLFFLIGKNIAASDKKIIKKIIKTKKYMMITDRMVNNFYGNIISIFGFIIVLSMIFGITNYLFFGITCISIFIAFIFHVSNATGYSLDDTIKEIMTNPFNKKLFFQKTVLTIIVSLLLTGLVSTNIVAPMLFKEIKNNNNDITVPYEVEHTDKEEEFYKELDNYFKK